MTISNHKYRNPILRFILHGWRTIKMVTPADEYGYAMFSVTYHKWHPGYWLTLVWFRHRWRHAVHVEVQNNG